jgi:hypothetical protein
MDQKGERAANTLLRPGFESVSAIKRVDTKLLQS